VTPGPSEEQPRPGATEDAPEGAESGQRPSLASRAIRSGLWLFAGQGFQNALRLGSNLVLTRLLVPDAFGLMALVNGVLQGLRMFSDVGIAPSIIQNEKGDDPDFLNTAWTIQAGRGVILYAVACALAIPVAWFYGEPQLRAVLPVVCLTALIGGFNSTRLVTLNRGLFLREIVLIELGTQVLAVATMITWAWIDATVWALVAGSLVSALAKLIISHTVVPGIRNRPRWHHESARELFRFGRWIFPSTVMTFLTSRSDRLILGRFMTLGELGVYYIAYVLADALLAVLKKLAAKILFPLYARLAEEEPERLRARLTRARILLLGLVLPPLAVLVAWGPAVIRLLYSEDYAGAGWMLQLLAAGAVVTAISESASPIVLARGDSFRHMVQLAVHSVVFMGAMLAGGALGGVTGLIVGIAATPALSYPAVAWAVHRHRAWQPLLDLGTLLGAAALAGLLFLIGRPFGLVP